jgi:hypothetical protein
MLVRSRNAQNYLKLQFVWVCFVLFFFSKMFFFLEKKLPNTCAVQRCRFLQITFRNVLEIKILNVLKHCVFLSKQKNIKKQWSQHISVENRYTCSIAQKIYRVGIESSQQVKRVLGRPQTNVLSLQGHSKPPPKPYEKSEKKTLFSTFLFFLLLPNGQRK